MKWWCNLQLSLSTGIIELFSPRLLSEAWVKIYWCVLFYFSITLFFSWALNRKYLEELCVWVESNTTTLSILSSQTEIGLGFLLLISLFSSVSESLSFLMHRNLFIALLCYDFVHFSTRLLIWCYLCRWQRNIIQTFMYWQVQYSSLVKNIKWFA